MLESNLKSDKVRGQYRARETTLIISFTNTFLLSYIIVIRYEQCLLVVFWKLGSNLEKEKKSIVHR
jgi:hypothetical protein